MGENGGDNLSLVLEAIGEQWADRPVDQARGQRFLLGRPAFAFKKAARDLAGGVCLLLVVHGEGEEVETFSRFLLGDDRRQHGGLAIRHHDGGVCLTGDPARFHDERTSAPTDFLAMYVEH